MTSFIRRALVPALARTVAVCTLSVGFASALEAVIPGSPAIALTQEEVASRLSIVPAFVIGIGENFVTYPVASADGEVPEREVMPVFWNQQDAEDYIARTRTQENLPDLPPEATVLGSRLDYLYTLEVTSQTEGDRPLELAFVPEPEEVEEAKALNAEFTQGVPLFYPQLENGSIIAVSQGGGEDIFPLFFSRADVESLLVELNEQSSEARDVVEVGVVPLEFVLRQMVAGEDEALGQFQLFPASDVISDLQQNSSQE